MGNAGGKPPWPGVEVWGGVLDFGEGSGEVVALMKYSGVTNTQNSHFSFLGRSFTCFNVLRLGGTQILPSPSPAALLRRKNKNSSLLPGSSRPKGLRAVSSASWESQISSC